jgi:outer membrane cobalamin receptor
LAGNLFDAGATYNINDNNSITAALHSSSRAPNFNFLLYQSDYQNFNWRNDDFERQQTQSLTFKFNSKFLGNLSAKYSAIDNYTFFNESNLPQQFENNSRGYC